LTFKNDGSFSSQYIFNIKISKQIISVEENGMYFPFLERSANDLDLLQHLLEIN
jgi:hypothetical protein